MTSSPATKTADGKKGPKDYSEYSRLLSCFIRDIRKDLTAPKLPFVVGVLGTGGATSGDGTEAFRNAMSAPAKTEEFKGNVANVFTHEYWPTEIDAVQAKVSTLNKEFAKRDRPVKDKQKKGEDWKKEAAQIVTEKRAKIEATLSKDELFILDNGISNRGFHYHGSAKFFAQIGKAFADTVVELKKGK